VAASVAPRRVVLAGAVDATGKSVDAAAHYSGAKNVEVRPNASWDAAALRSI